MICSKVLPVIFLTWILCSCHSSPGTGDEQQTAGSNKIEKSDTVEHTRLIVPGESIGLSRLNERADSVVKLLGAPDSGDAAMGKSVSYWFSEKQPGKERDQVMIYFVNNMGGKDEGPRAKQISVSSSFFITEQRLGNGSSFNEICEAFPRLKKIGSYPGRQKTDSIVIYDDIMSGIAFDIAKNGRCVAVTVHELNKDPLQTYLSIHPGSKHF